MVNIPGYSINVKLAEGACAEIFAGIEHQTSRQVAIKILHTKHLANKAEYKRLVEEGILGLRLPQHDNIVQFYNAGILDKKIPYIVMEYVKGRTLREMLAEREKFTDIFVLNLAKNLARALRSVHNIFICHKDLKPDNIMIRDDGGVKLLDFGFAEATKGFSLFGKPLEGSLEYMAPELFATKKSTPATDIYALGCTLYEAATGFPPFGGMSEREVIAKQKNMNLHPPSLREANPRISLQTEKTIVTAIQKDVANRFKSADELLLDLSRNIALRANESSQRMNAVREQRNAL